MLILVIFWKKKKKKEYVKIYGVEYWLYNFLLGVEEIQILLRFKLKKKKKKKKRIRMFYLVITKSFSNDYSKTPFLRGFRVH